MFKTTNISFRMNSNYLISILFFIMLSVIIMFSVYEFGISMNEPKRGSHDVKV